MWTKSQRYIGGHLMELLEASVDSLSRVLGQPYRKDGFDFPDAPDKVNVCWCVKAKDGSIVTIWDYKQPLQPDNLVRPFSVWYNHLEAWSNLQQQITIEAYSISLGEQITYKGAGRKEVDEIQLDSTHCLPPYPVAPGMCFQNPALRRYRAIKQVCPMFEQSNELTLGFLSERYIDARFWLNGRRYERVADFYDTWLVESLEYESDPFPLTLWWDKRKLKARLASEQLKKRHEPQAAKMNIWLFTALFIPLA